MGHGRLRRDEDGLLARLGGARGWGDYEDIGYCISRIPRLICSLSAPHSPQAVSFRPCHSSQRLLRFRVSPRILLTSRALLAYRYAWYIHRLHVSFCFALSGARLLPRLSCDDLRLRLTQQTSTFCRQRYSFERHCSQFPNDCYATAAVATAPPGPGACGAYRDSC